MENLNEVWVVQRQRLDFGDRQIINICKDKAHAEKIVKDNNEYNAGSISKWHYFCGAYKLT